MLDKTIKIYTIAIPQWRKAKALGIQLLDITAKGKSVFAPDYHLVMEYKAGRVSEKNYTDFYYRKMRVSLIENREHWENLLKYKEVALGCYCGAGQYCHRLLFKDIMAKYCEYKGYSVIYEGEIT